MKYFIATLNMLVNNLSFAANDSLAAYLVLSDASMLVLYAVLVSVQK
ncbi:hypothetical protein [Bacillus thuringiensis]|nr:hypothetical protein [Bacillus thuringiensis]